MAKKITDLRKYDKNAACGTNEYTNRVRAKSHRKHRAKEIKACKKYYQEHKEYHKEKNRQHYMENKYKWKERRAENYRRWIMSRCPASMINSTLAELGIDLRVEGAFTVMQTFAFFDAFGITREELAATSDSMAERCRMFYDDYLAAKEKQKTSA